MSALFKKAENTQAFLKMGLMGFAGSGKTFTATNVAIGLVHYIRERNIDRGSMPAMFLDTETGSDWVRPRFNDAGIELFTAKTRAFSDLIPAVKEAEKSGSVLIIDSISHFWTELTDSYAKKKNRHRGLEFQDWAWLKGQWRQFTDIFVNSQCHIIMCGRAGYEYDFFENENGKRELEKTGVKMKAETETGYEPSILVLMEKQMDMENKRIYREAHILKDRSDLIDGKTFKNPTFETFLPHIKFLNVGGKQLGVDTSRTSEAIISANERSDWKMAQEQKEIILERLQALFTKHYSTASAEGKRAIIGHLEKHFGTPSWKELDTKKVDELKEGYNAAHLELEGVSVYMLGASSEPSSVANYPRPHNDGGNARHD